LFVQRLLISLILISNHLLADVFAVFDLRNRSAHCHHSHFRLSNKSIVLIQVQFSGMAS
jgi:hypothetical protein